MSKFYKVLITHKHDADLENDEIMPAKWIIMSKEQLEKYIQQPLNEENANGRTTIGYSEIVWKSHQLS
ncbi:MAG: hypothetical protein PHX21_00880 [bacterium]|nr:hypothetical protein [bacterium]